MFPPFPPGCLVVVGLAAEAALLPRGVSFICAGGRVDLLTERLAERLARQPPPAILSFGIAGGLLPGLPNGTLITAEAILDAGERLPCDAPWSSAWAGAAGAWPGLIAAADTVIGSVGAKAALHRRTAALAVDMESGAAARAALAHGLPFAALRAIADPAGDALVPSAAVGLHPDGRPAPGRVLASLVRRPQDLAGLLRIAWQTRGALAALRLAVRRASA